MYIATSNQMRNIDKYTIENLGIPGIVLMENAARSVAQVCIEKVENIKENYVLILTGKGNNGGDGFALARILYNKGINVDIAFLGNSNEIIGEALINFNIAKNIGINIITDYNIIYKNINSANLIIDAIFGTGIKGVVKEYFKSIIEAVNKSKSIVVSVDIPSGIDADTGKVLGCGIKADYTVTFELPKVGIILYPGAEYAGEVIVSDISIPNYIIENTNIKYNMIKNYEASAILPKRKLRSSKSDYGRLFIIAGSDNMTGAAALACKGAYKAGAGVVYSCTTKNAAKAVQIIIPEAVQFIINDLDGKICEDNFEMLKCDIERASAVVIGPGLGKGNEVNKFVYKVIEEIKCNMIIDADGLNAVAQNIEILKHTNNLNIITPHPGEMSRLTGKTINEILNDTIGTAVEFSREYNVITVLKDARTIIAHPDGRVFVNTTGNPAMAKGGSGDVLSGIIGALLSQELEPFIAAILGVYVHGMAGDMAKSYIGSYGVLATDIAEYTAQALNFLALS